MAFAPIPNFVSVAPADQSAVTSATYQMVGLGAAAAAWVITPNSTGRVLFGATYTVVGTNGNLLTTQLSFGTGSAPANAASVTGTQVGAQPAVTALTGFLTWSASMTWLTTGLTLGTQIWMDIAVKAAASTAQITKVNAWAIEL